MSINKKYLRVAMTTLLLISLNVTAQSSGARIAKGNTFNADGSTKPASLTDMPNLPPIVSPTLDEIAEHQRLKQRAEFAKVKAEAALVASAAKAAALVITTTEKNTKAAAAAVADAVKVSKKKVLPPIVIPPPTHRLNAVYKLKNKWKAEFIEGTNIVTYEVGDRFGNFAVNDINDSSVKLTSDKKGQFTALVGTSF